METSNSYPRSHIGRKIVGIRQLRGITQTELGKSLGITKQAVSKLERSEKISDEKLEQIAEALGVTLKMLKSYTDEDVLNTTYNLHDNSHITHSIGSVGTINIKNFNNIPIEEIIDHFETLLKKEKNN